MNLALDVKNSSSVSVSWVAHNRAATYTVSALGDDGVHTCTTNGTSCDITDLPCGSTYEVSVIAANSAGQSLPSYTDSLETGEWLKAWIDPGSEECCLIHWSEITKRHW